MKPKIVTGPNGSGKTALIDELVREATGRYPASEVRYLAFRDTYGASDAGYYLQQRWNSCDIDDNPLARMSSGELRKYQISKALQYNPRFLVIDSPFIGLDAEARVRLDSLLRELSEKESLELVLVVASDQDIPDYAGEVIRLENRPEPSSSIENACRAVASRGGFLPDYENAVILEDVSIRFGDRVILKPLDWTMKAGEKWALEGPNGSGKSTLLSIICADIPQAYACNVTLFDRPRGSGESIWDIKRHIGYVSPELHRAFKHNVPVIDVVASGLHDRQGMYVKTDESMIPECDFWLDVFGIASLRDRSFMEISSGEQRMVLLARAFVKDPELLILDEPMHGLDDLNGERVRKVTDAFCSREGKSMIMVSHYPEDFPSCISHHLKLA